MKTTGYLLTLILTGAIKLAYCQGGYWSENSPPPNHDGTIWPTGYVEAGLGVAQPLADFASRGKSAYSGYALLGHSFNFSFAVPKQHSNYGLVAEYNYTWNDYDINSYLSNIQTPESKYVYKPLSYQQYEENFFMAGLFYTVPVHRLSFDFRLMGGLAICHLPEVDYSSNTTSPTATRNFEWDTYSSLSPAFVYDLGGGIRYRIERIALLAGVDYKYANPMVKTTQANTDEYGNETKTPYGGFNVPISMINYSLGVSYAF